jgi:hypothetical protein
MPPLAPLYDLGSTTATITVTAPGALAGAATVPTMPLTVELEAGSVLDFGGAKFARLSGPAAAGDDALDTDALPTALIDGDEATITLAAPNPLLGEKWTKLGGQSLSGDARTALQTAYQVNAELALDLRAGYTGNDAMELAYAIVLQILFVLEHGITPSIVKSVSQANPGANKVYRDRWIDPTAAAIVARVTGRQQVRFAPFMAGV